jgi:hypothetical protein
MAFVGTADLTTSLANHEWGGTSELFGDTWTYSEVNSSSFAITIKGVLKSGGTAVAEIAVDSVEVTIYTVGAETKAWKGYVRAEEILSP